MTTWNEDRAADFMAHYQSGASDRAIANRMSMPCAAISAHRLRLGLAPNPPKAKRSKWTNEDTQKLIDLHAQGLCDRAIVNRIGFSTNTICAKRKELGLRANKSPRMAAKGARKSPPPAPDKYIPPVIKRREENGIVVTVYAPGWAIGSTRGVI